MDEGVVMVFTGDGSGAFILVDDEYAAPPPLINAYRSPIVMADLNQDGHQDLVVQGGMFVYLGDGHGEFTPRENYYMHTGMFVVDDFNGDSYPDIVEASAQTIALGNGAGGFSLPQVIAIPTPPSSVATADFNLDGHADLAFASYTTAEVWILLGTGTGAFQTPVSIATSNPGYSLAAGKFTADDYPDLVVTNGQLSYNSDLLAGDGAGGFQLAQSIVIYLGHTATAGRIDGDDRDDALLGWTLLQTGGEPEGFVHARRFPAGMGPLDLETSDFDEDDRPDIAVANAHDNTVLLLHGTGDGSLDPGLVIPVGQEPWSIAAGDINDDDHSDLAIACREGAIILILRGDGLGGMEELLQVPGPGRPTSVEFRDMNHDENLDLVTSQYDQPMLEVRLGDGLGGFGPALTCQTPASNAVDLAVGELSGDEHQDVVLVYEQAGASIFLGDGSGALNPLPLIDLGHISSRVAIGHLDNDEIPDLAVTGIDAAQRHPGTDDTRGITLGGRSLRGLGEGQFDSPQSLGVTGGSTGVVIADVTGDLSNDISVCVPVKHGVTVKAGTGKGGFGANDEYGGGRHPEDLVAADLDRDGHLDLITADWEGNTVHVLLSELADVSAVSNGLPLPQPIAGRGLASPNPAPRGGVISIAFGDEPANAIRIYDVGGRLVARLARTPGSDRFVWSGRDLSGRLVAAGQYFARLEGRTYLHPSVKVSILP
jgi:hypothetical protein